MSSLDRRRVVASGSLWTMVYNVLWGIAWFAFMHTEWTAAAAAAKRPMPFTAEAWFAAVVMSIPIGIAIMAHSRGRGRSAAKAAVAATLLVWILMTVGMFVWGIQSSFPLRTLVLDSTVNLFAMGVAALVGAWSQLD
jgi:hypothetical protein